MALRSGVGKSPPGIEEDYGSFSWHKDPFRRENDSTIGPSAASNSITAPTERTGLLSTPGNSNDTTATNPCWGSFAPCCSSNFIITPKSVEEKLQELQAELDHFPVQSTTIFRYLQQQHQDGKEQEHNANNEYLKNLQILMLQSEQWVVSNAAGRFLRFLNAKLQWFGAEALCKPLIPTRTASGNAFDQTYLWSGIFQVLEARETKQGFTVLVIVPSLAETVMNLVDLIRSWWFFAAIVVERNERRNQNRTGFVAVIYHVGTTNATNRRDLGGASSHQLSPTLKDWDIPLCYWNGLCSLQQLPLSIEEWHFCTDDESALWVKPCSSFSSRTVLQGKDRTTIERYRQVYFHQGSQTECLYKLLQCGIPAGDLPLMDDGMIDVTRHHQWMRDSVGHTTIM